MIVAAAVGFLPALIDSERRLGPVNPLVVLHGLVFSAWLLLFFIQSCLIAAHRRALHRRLGIWGAALAFLMLPLGYFTVVDQTRRGYDLSGELNVRSDPLGAAIFPLGDLVTFALLVSAGLWYRKQPGVHKRLMALATVGGMMPAALAHVVGHYFMSMPIVLLPMIAVAFFAPALLDRLRDGRFHPVTLWGGVLLFGWANVRAVLIRPTAGWREFVWWLAG